MLDVERSRNIARDGQINKFSQRDALGAEIQVFDEAWNVLETIENEARDRLCELSQADWSIESESSLENRPLGTRQRAACVAILSLDLSSQPSLGG